MPTMPAPMMVIFFMRLPWGSRYFKVSRDTRLNFRRQTHRSAFYCDDVRLNFSIYSGASEALFERVRGDGGCFVETIRRAGFDFVSQRRSLAVRDGRYSRRCCAAPRRHCVNAGFSAEPGGGKIARDRACVVIAMRRA